MKRYLITALIGVALFGFGCAYFCFEILDLNFVNKAPNYNEQIKTKTYEYSLKDNEYYRFMSSSGTLELKNKDDLVDKVIVEVYSYPSFGKIKYETGSIYEEKPTKTIYFYQTDETNWDQVKELKNNILKDIKNKEIHNYYKLITPKITITVPTKRKKQVSIIENVDPIEKLLKEQEVKNG